MNVAGRFADALGWWRAWPVGLVIGLVGIAAAVMVPFAPVWVRQAAVVWPAPGAATVSSTAFFAPYRPQRLTVEVPCPVVAAAVARAGATTVLSTAAQGQGLAVRVDAGRVEVAIDGAPLLSAPASGPRCGVHVAAGPHGVTGTAATSTKILPGAPVPVVRMFHTDLDPAAAAGMRVTARTSSWFAQRATTIKTVLLWVWLCAAVLAVGWMWIGTRGPPPDGEPGSAEVVARSGGGAGGTAAVIDTVIGVVVDAVVVLLLGGWAVIGPLSDDDGFATMIARNSVSAGFQGNYYRWWNASETPFALAEHVLAPLSGVSMQPLWLRLPSTVLAVGTWLVLSRAVLPAVVPAAAPERAIGPLVGARVGSGRVGWGTRGLGAVCFLACWLPFNLGVRPEAYVAFGVTAVLALLWRARTIRSVAVATLVAALTATASPSAVLLGAPALVLAPSVARAVRAGGARGGQVVARVAVLGALGCAAVVGVFADQSADAVRVATSWHTRFGPSLPWYQEYLRYQYLLAADQDGSATKRLPILLTLALLGPTVFVLARRMERPAPGRARLSPAACRMAAITVLGLLLLAGTPSKWTHHFGAFAGVFTTFLVLAVALLARCAQPVRVRWPDRAGLSRRSVTADWLPAVVGLVGAAVGVLAVVAAFAGPNAWWQPALYDVPWSAGPITPAGVPLSSPLLWVGLLAAGYVVVRVVGARVGVLVAAPALLAVVSLSMSVAVLLGSFVAAPLRQPSGSLALANLRTLSGRPGCGVGDDIQVLPDIAGSVMNPAGTDTGTGSAVGFDFGRGFDPAAPPPEPAGSGASSWLWGSRTAGTPTGGPGGTGALTTPWFILTPPRPGQEVAVSVAGRTDQGNSLSLEFGRSGVDDTAVVLGRRSPPDPLRTFGADRPPDHRLWRTVGVAAEQIPAGADRVRIQAIHASPGPEGWLAVTGPRLRHVVGLREFLDHHGPTLVAWPVAFLFPCITNRVAVHDGLAQAPATVLEAPQRYSGLSAATTDPHIGGDFTALRTLGRLGEISTRLAYRPGTDWGDLLLTDYPASTDTYQRAISWTAIPGLGGITLTPGPDTAPTAALPDPTTPPN